MEVEKIGTQNRFYYITFAVSQNVAAKLWNRGTFQKIHSQEETGLPNVPAELDKLIDSL